MKRRTQMIVAAAVLVGLAGVSAMKRGGGESGKCGSGTCCPMLPGLSLWRSNSFAQVESKRTKPEASNSEAVTNRMR